MLHIQRKSNPKMSCSNGYVWTEYKINSLYYIYFHLMQKCEFQQIIVNILWFNTVLCKWILTVHNVCEH